MQNVLTISLSSPSLSFGYSIHLAVCSFLALLPSCSLLCLLALVTFPSVSPLIWCSCLSFLLTVPPAPFLLMPQIYKRFLVFTSLTPMPHYRPMAPTVGFAPPLCVTLTFLTLCSVFCLPSFWLPCAFFVSLFIPLLIDIHVIMLHGVTYC